LVFVVKQVVVLGHHYVKVEIPRVTRDDSVVNHLFSNLSIFEKILQNLLSIDNSKLRHVDDYIILGYFLVVGKVGINKREHWLINLL
jgi:hypothetical protein